YRYAKAAWHAYHAVLLEPVTLWRSGRKSLDPVPKEDMLRLVTDFQTAVRTALGEDFHVVDQPGPGVMRIRLGITDARATDSMLDVLTARRGTGRPHPAGNGPLDPETRRFLESAVIEGEIRDAQTNTLLAEGIDRRRPGAPTFETWADVDHAFARWAERAGARLEARTGGRRDARVRDGPKSRARRRRTSRRDPLAHPPPSPAPPVPSPLPGSPPHHRL